MSPSAAGGAFAQAGELKFGQVGIATLRVLDLNVARLAQETRERVQRAPGLFARAALILDFGTLPALPDAATAQALVAALRESGALPVALAWGSPDNAQLAERLGLPLLAKFRAQSVQPEPIDDARVAAPPPSADAPPAAQTLVRSAPLRSGQQVYARGGDLTIVSSVAAGAEVLADGSIHIYGSLRGRALAGAGGNAQARIFCRSFQAELVAVAGRYLVWDDVPHEFHGKAVQIRLDHDSVTLELLPHG